MILAKDLTKTFGKVQALRGVSFSIDSGESVGLIGPNAAGKTTILNIILGHLKPDYGEVKVFGHDPWVDYIKVREFTGVMHEKPLLPRKIRVRDFLKIFSDLRELDCGYVLNLACEYGLRPYFNFKIGDLSRGFLQRLNLIQAIASKPKLLLLDEPTANLDPAARLKTLSLLREMKKRGTTIVVSSHLLGELETFCEKVILIKDGYLVEEGKIEVLAKKYSLYLTYELIVADFEKALSYLNELQNIVNELIIVYSKRKLRVSVNINRLNDFKEFLSKSNFKVLKVEPPSLEDLYRRIVGGDED